MKTLRILTLTLLAFLCALPKVEAQSSVLAVTYSAYNPSPNAPGGNCLTQTTPVYNYLSGVYFYCKPNSIPPTNLGSWTSFVPNSINFCGTTTTCSPSNIAVNSVMFTGTVALTSGTPSTAVVTGFAPAFTSASTYTCTLTNTTTAADGVKVVNTSASSITITGPNTVTDVIAYQCVGY